ncbi:MAG: hypothetical protein ACXWHB_06260 [Usitatibacter sp.]
MTRQNLALAALAAIAGAFAVAFTWRPGLASLYDDSVSYLIMAQAFSPFSPASDAVAAAWPRQKYPPLFPLLLALGGGAADWRIAHAWVAASFAASVLLLGIHARNISRSARLGFAAALVYACLPGAWLNMKGILSEFPFMAVSFGALAWHDRIRAGPASRRNHLVLGALLAAALLTRTIGIALVAAVAVSELVAFTRTRDRARALMLPWALVPPLALAGLWYLVRPKAGEDAYVTFGAGVASAAAQQGAGWLASLAAHNVSVLLDAWYTALLIFWGEPWRAGFLAASFIALSGAAGSIARAWRGESDGLYVLLFAAILVAWPFPGQMFRLALPVIPLLLAHALWSWQCAAERFAGEERARSRAAYGALVPLALCVPAIVFYIADRALAAESSPEGTYRRTDIAEYYRIPDRRSAEANAQRQIGVLEDFDRIRRSTPERASVMWYAPDYLSLLASRRGVALERADVSSMAAQMRAAHPDFIYIAAVHPRDTAARLGDPLEGVTAALPFSHAVWKRVNARGELEAVLLETDRARIEPPIPAPTKTETGRP